MNEHAFSLTRGGPLYHVLRRAHLVDGTGKLTRGLAGGCRVDPAGGRCADRPRHHGNAESGRDGPLGPRAVARHAAAPGRRGEPARGSLRGGGAARLRGAARPSHGASRRSSRRASHLRDAWQPEALLLVLVLGVGQLWLRSYSGVHQGGLTLARAWCFLFALPLVQFVLVRWLWRWAVWTYVLARLARVPLALDALHPDRAGGLKIFASPTDAFAVFVAAIMSMVAAAWWERIESGACDDPVGDAAVLHASRGRGRRRVRSSGAVLPVSSTGPVTAMRPRTTRLHTTTSTRSAPSGSRSAAPSRCSARATSAA